MNAVNALLFVIVIMVVTVVVAVLLLLQLCCDLALLRRLHLKIDVAVGRRLGAQHLSSSSAWTARSIVVSRGKNEKRIFIKTFVFVIQF